MAKMRGKKKVRKRKSSAAFKPDRKVGGRKKKGGRGRRKIYTSRPQEVPLREPQSDHFLEEPGDLSMTFADEALPGDPFDPSQDS